MLELEKGIQLKIISITFFIYILLWIPLPAEVKMNPANKVTAISVHYKTVSVIEPWKSPRTFQLTIPAINTGNGIFFAIGEKNAFPVFALFANKLTESKLKLESYDPSTGFMLFYAPIRSKLEVSKYHKITSCNKLFKFKTWFNPMEISVNLKDFPEESKITNKFNSSSISLPAFKIPAGMGLNTNGFIYSNNHLCGIVQEDIILPAGLIKYYLQNRKKYNFNYRGEFLHNDLFTQSVFPDIGFTFRMDLSSSEIIYYFNNQGLNSFPKKGILVETVSNTNENPNSLLPGDAIYSINGLLIDGDNAENYIKELLIGHKHFPHKSAQIKIFRNGKARTINYPIKPYIPGKYLIPERGDPSYYIYGGLVFLELSGDYIRESGQNDPKLLYLYENFSKKSHPYKSKIVILSKILADDGNRGYHDIENQILARFNGKSVASLVDLKNLIDATANENFSEFVISGNKKIIFQNSEIENINQRIIKNYNIRKLYFLPTSRKNKINAENHSINFNFLRDNAKYISSN